MPCPTQGRGLRGQGGRLPGALEGLLGSEFLRSLERIRYMRKCRGGTGGQENGVGRDGGRGKVGTIGKKELEI